MGELELLYPRALWAAAVVLPLVVLATLRTRAEMGRRGMLISLVFRCVWVLVCVAAVSGPVVKKAKTERLGQRVVVLSDASGSIAAGAGVADRERIRAQVAEALGERVERVELEFAGRAWPRGEGAVETDQTDIAAALDAANEQMLDVSSGAVVVVSDGRSTRGNAVDAAARIALRGIPVHTIAVGREEARPPAIVRAEPPVDAHVGVPAAVRVTLASGAGSVGAARVRLIDSDGKAVDQRSLRLEGTQTMVLRFTPGKQGVEMYRIEVEAPGAGSGTAAVGMVDARPVPVFVEGPPRILVADNFPAEVEALRKALEPLKVPVDVVTPDSWPSEKELSQYAAVVLSDFSGRELDETQREQLRRHVEERGCGLLFVGGGNVIPSRWKGNALAAMLPVELNDKPADLVKKRPEASVVFVIDRSGSMSAPLGGGGQTSKLELVKAATIAAIQSLPDNAEVAVIAFDSQPHVVVDPTPVSKKEEISRKVDAIGAGGGTVIDPAAREGLRLLAQMPGDRYMIVLTDGRAEQPGSNTAYWGALGQDARRQRVSLTTIAVGQDADQDMLRHVANEARGNFFYCDTDDKVPRVFIQQAKSIKRVAEQKERSFRPRFGPAAAQRFKDVRAEELPELAGRVRATGRRGSDTLLLSEGEEPLMSSWQYGLGRVVAFTSDAKPAWAKEWIGWNGFSSFWLQTVQGILRTTPALHVRARSWVEGDGGTAVYNFVVTDDKGRPAADLRTTGVVGTTAAGKGEAVAAPATGPAVTWSQPGAGEYQARVALPRDGAARVIDVTLARADGRAVRYVALAAAERTGELSRVGADLAALRAIAAAGHGVCATSAGEVVGTMDFNPTRTGVSRSPLWPGLILVAILMWPVDLGVRKFM